MIQTLVKTKLEALLTAIERIVLAVQRWWNGLGLSKKPDAALKAIGIFLGANAFYFAFLFSWRWVVTSSFGVWLEINKPTKPGRPGTILFLEIVTLVLAVIFYRDKIKGD